MVTGHAEQRRSLRRRIPNALRGNTSSREVRCWLVSAHKLWCARSSTPSAPAAARIKTTSTIADDRPRPATETERSNTTLPTNSGARQRRRTLAPGARKAVQPHARKYVDLSDFGTIRSRSSNEARPTKADRTGACFPAASARAAQRHRPSDALRDTRRGVRKRKSPTRALGAS